TSIHHARPFSIGINCALGARDMRPYIAELARMAACYISCYPNAGLPNAFGEYDELPDETSRLLQDFVASGFTNIVGGCCGPPPEQIAAIGRAVESLTPRRLPDPGAAKPAGRFAQFSGLETLVIRPDSNFQMIGERTNVTGSKRFARLIKADNYGEAAHVAA